jgi:hypothetical protein
MKLYEILLRKWGFWTDDAQVSQVSGRSKSQSTNPKPKEIYNPLHCKIGGVLKIDSLDLRGHRFTVKEIKEYSFDIKSDYKMVDYILESRPLDKENLEIRLRVVPDNKSNSRFDVKCLVLNLYDEFEYSDDFLGVVQDENKKFVIDDDKSDDDPSNDVHEEYWRVNDVGSSYVSSVLAKNAEKEVKSKVEFWDYSRNTEVDGIEVEEFVFVEMNKENGWFQIWRGAEEIPERIEVY